MYLLNISKEMNSETFDLATLFQAVGQVLEHNRQALNQADPYNGNHGDHMVQIFQLASRAVEEKRGMPLAEAMEHAASLLEDHKQNSSALVYARGLSCMAEQFRKYEISINDLVSYVQAVLVEDRDRLRTEEILHYPRGSQEVLNHSDPEKKDQSNAEAPSVKSGKVLKALASGLAAWGQEKNGRILSSNPLDVGSLFEFGMAYIQALQRGGSKIEVLADAAASVSPLSKVPHRCQSGKIAIQALLQTMQVGMTGLEGE
jgi:hypothetical protein